MQAKQLLPGRLDVFGNVHALGYNELRARYEHVPADYLFRVLTGLVQGLGGSSGGFPGVPGSAGVSTLLGSGSFALTQPVAPRQDTPRLGPLPRSQDASTSRSLARRVLGREAGAVQAHGGGCFTQLCSMERMVGSYRHHRTVRGHLRSVQGILLDPAGRYIATGSDDGVVKIWCALTACLLATCLGHQESISDLVVSSDGKLLASS